MSEQDIQQVREYADRVAELLGPMEMPSLEPVWESEPPGLDHTNRVARRIRMEWYKALRPLKAQYRKKVVAVLEDAWEPIADIFEHWVPQALGRLDAWRREILDHTNPAGAPHVYWLESSGEEHRQYGPNGPLRDVIRKFESKLRREAKRTEETLKRAKLGQEQKSETVTGVERGTDGPEDEVHYSPEEGFTGITDRNKASDNMYTRTWK